MESPKARVNASMLAQFIDQPVCFVGRLEKVRTLTTLGFLGEGPVTVRVAASGYVTEGEGGGTAL